MTLELDVTILDRPGPQSRLLVLLHGYGEPAEQLTDRLDLIDPNGMFRVVVPQAPFERKGAAIWHRAMRARDEAEAQLLASIDALDHLLGRLEADLGLAAAEAVVGGFSQGGGLALGLLLGADVVHRPAAGFGVCSFPPSVRRFRVDPAAAAGRPYLLASAPDDHFAPIEMSRAGAALLRDTGIDITYVETAGGHEMTDEAARAVGTWLAALGTAGGAADLSLLEGASVAGSYFDGLWELV